MKQTPQILEDEDLIEPLWYLRNWATSPWSVTSGGI